MSLQGTLDTFSLAEILGLVEHARQTGALDVNGPDGHGTLYTRDGRFCAGEAADYSGPVDDRALLDVRLVDVCFHLLRFPEGGFEFVAGREPPWPAERCTDIAPIVRRVEEIVREWPLVEAVIPSLDAPLEMANDLADDQLTISRATFQILASIDGAHTARQIAREKGRSVVEVSFLLKELVEHGAVRMVGDEREREPEPGPSVVLPPGALHAVRDSQDPGREEVVTSVPDPVVMFDREDLERERAALAARAGLDSAGPVPDPDATTPGEADPADPPSSISTDRGALLRLFSGLRGDQ